MYWHWILILSLLQPIFSEHTVFNGTERCCHFSRSPHNGNNAFLNRKNQLEDANLRLNVESETSQNERRDGELRRKDTHLSIERHLERQIFASTDQSRSRSRTTEANERRLHRTLRYVRTEPEIRTSLDISQAHIKNFRVYDTPQVWGWTVSEIIALKNGRNLDYNLERTDRINRSFRRLVLNESITPKKDTEKHIDRYRHGISETSRNEHSSIFRNTVRYSRDNDRQRNSASQQRHIEDGHITSSLDRFHKLYNRSIYQEDTRSPDRDTKLRGQRIETRRIETKQHRKVLDQVMRQSGESRSRIEENINERFDRTDTRITERDNSKIVPHAEWNIPKQSSRRVTGGHSTQKREEQSRNLRRERRDARNRERFLRENSPGNNNIPTQHRKRGVENKHDSNRNEYNALSYARYTRDTASVREAERYANKKKVARSMDREVQSNSERFKNQFLRRILEERSLSIRGRDTAIGHNIHLSGVRLASIERERFITLDRTVHRHNIANNNHQITHSSRSRETDSLIVRQKRTGSKNYKKVLESAFPLQNDRRTLVAHFSRRREQFEANKYEGVRTNKLNTENKFSVQCSRSFVDCIKEKSDIIMDIDRNTNKINIDRYARDNIRDSANAGKHDVRKHSTRLIKREHIRSESKPVSNERDHHRIIERIIFRISGEHKIREEYRNVRNYERNSKYTERRDTLEPFVQQTDIRSTNRRIVQNREECNTSEERKNVLNERKNSLSADRFKTRTQIRNNTVDINRGYEVRNRENEYHRNINRHIFSIGLRQVDDTKVFQNHEARKTDLNQERTHTGNMERSALQERTYEQISNIINERKMTDEDHIIRYKNERMTIHRRNAREERNYKIRDEGRRLKEVTRLKTEVSPRRTNEKNIGDSIVNGQQTSDLNREFRKMDIDRDQSRQNIDFAYTRRTISPTKAFTDYKSTENSSLFYWQYLFYAIQGFYILIVFKQILRRKETNKNTNSFEWPSRRVIKVD